MTVTQSQLHLFDEQVLPGSDARITFSELTRSEFPDIHIKLSSRLKSNWYVEWKNFGRLAIVTVPLLMEWAPLSAKRNLFHWARLMKTRKKSWTKEKRVQRTALEENIRREIKIPDLTTGELANLDPRQQQALKRISKRRSKFDRSLNPQGIRHDLRHIFNEVNQEYFNGRLASKITWSNRVGGQSTHTTEPDWGGGPAEPVHLITISQGYNAENVSAEILGGVVYHECLHIDIPPVIKNGRRIVHSPEFKRREKQYRHYAAWVHWHEHVLRKNLRSIRFKKTMRKLKGALWGQTKTR